MSCESNHLLIGYSHKLCASIALKYFAGKIVDQRFFVWISVYISLFMTHRVSLNSKGTRTYQWRFYLGKTSTSPRSVSCVGILFSYRTLLSVCGEQHLVLSTAWIVWGFLWEPLWPTTQLDNSILVPKASFGDKRCKSGILFL